MKLDQMKELLNKYSLDDSEKEAFAKAYEDTNDFDRSLLGKLLAEEVPKISEKICHQTVKEVSKLCVAEEVYAPVISMIASQVAGKLLLCVLGNVEKDAHKILKMVVYDGVVESIGEFNYNMQRGLKEYNNIHHVKR